MAILQAPATLPDGTYDAQVTAIEEREARDGETYLRWHVLTPEGEVTGTSSINAGPRSKPARWAKALGQPITSQLDTDTLIGRHCTVSVAVHEQSGYSRITEILPPARRSGAETF